MAKTKQELLDELDALDEDLKSYYSAREAIKTKIRQIRNDERQAKIDEANAEAGANRDAILEQIATEKAEREANALAEREALEQKLADDEAEREARKEEHDARMADLKAEIDAKIKTAKNG